MYLALPGANLLLVRAVSAVTPSVHEVDMYLVRSFTMTLLSWGVYGRDRERGWYTSLPIEYRYQRLCYAMSWLRSNDPRGHFEIPGLRPLPTADAVVLNDVFCGDAEGVKSTLFIQGSIGGPTLSLSLARAGEGIKGEGRLSRDGQWSEFLDSRGCPPDLGCNVTVWTAPFHYGIARGALFASMQWDGNFVVYGSPGDTDPSFDTVTVLQRNDT
jgi:hypothetical protein